MTTIVMNTLTGDVSEYDWAFQSITPTHAGDAAGLFALGGDTDAGNPVAARALLPATDQGTSLAKRIGDVYLSIQGPALSEGRVLVQQVTEDGEGQTVTEEYEYPLVLRPSGVSRATPGKGIKASRLAVGFANSNGAAFSINKLEADVIEAKSGRRLT